MTKCLRYACKNRFEQKPGRRRLYCSNTCRDRVYTKRIGGWRMRRGHTGLPQDRAIVARDILDSLGAR